MRSRWIGIFVGLVLGGSVAVFAQSWTTPRDWVAGELVTPSIMNSAVRDNLIVLRAGGVAMTSQAANDLVYASSATQFARIAGAASSVLVTSAGSVPSLSTSLPSGLTIPAPVFSGTITGTYTVGGTPTLPLISSTNYPATTSAQFAGVISNETGSGLVVFDTSPTLTTPVFSGTITGTYTLGGTPTLPLISSTNYPATTSAQLATVLSDETGTGVAVFSASPTFTGTVTAVTLDMTGSITATGAVSVGSTPATGGTIRIPVASGVTSRNNANSANVTLLLLNTSDVLELRAGAATLNAAGLFTATTFSGSGASLTSIPETAISDGALLSRYAEVGTWTAVGTYAFGGAGANVLKVVGNNSTTGATEFYVGNDASATNGALTSWGSAKVTSGPDIADSLKIYAERAGGIVLAAQSATGPIRFFAAGTTEVGRWDLTSSLQVGGSAARATTAGTKRLDIFDGTAPVGTLANGISLYATTGELRVMDAAGNATLLSPHDDDTNDWIYFSKNTVTGQVLRIDMERLMRRLDKEYGGGFIEEYTEDPVVTPRSGRKKK